MNGRFVSYCRVSTGRQQASGLGLDAQRAAVAAYLNGGDWELVGEFEEAETGKSEDRPELAKAIALCRLTGAKLIIAKLDRLARNVAFISTLMRGDVEFVACDMPTANKLVLHVMAAMAEHEAEMASTRTKAGLQAIKDKLARGEVHVSKRSGKVVTSLGATVMNHPRPDLGTAAAQKIADDFASRVGPTIKALRDAELPLATIADRLNEMRVQTARGKAWTPMAVKRVLDRLAA